MLSGALLVAQAGIARRFGTPGLGEYTAAALTVYLAGAIAAVAVPVIVGRDAAALDERHESDAADHLVGVALLALLFVSAVVGAVVAVVWEPITGPLIATALPPVLVVGGVMGATAGAYCARILQSRLEMSAAALVAIAQPFAVVAGLGIDTFFAAVGPAEIAVSGFVVSGALGGTILAMKGSGPRVDLAQAVSAMRRSFPYAPIYYANHVAGLVDRVVVSIVLGPAGLGIYQAASILAEGSLRLLQGGVSFFVAAYGRAQVRSREHGDRLQRLSVRVWVTYGAAVAAVLIAGADGIVGIYGSFAPAIPPLIVLAAGLIPTIVTVTLATAGAGTGRRTSLVIARLAIPFQFVVGVILTSAFGVVGMAIAQVVVMIPVALAQMYWSHDRSLLPTRAVGLRLVLVGILVPSFALVMSGLPVPWMIRAAIAGAACGSLAAVALLGPDERDVVGQLLSLRRARTVDPA